MLSKLGLGPQSTQLLFFSFFGVVRRVSEQITMIYNHVSIVAYAPAKCPRTPWGEERLK